MRIASILTVRRLTGGVFVGTILGAIAAFAAFPATPARAQNYPWCAQYDGEFGGMNCGFVSFGQCLETVRGLGGFCIMNNTYAPPAGTARPGRRAVRP